MREKVDDGQGERRKKEKRGFKEDRAARWLEKHRKEKELLSGKKLPKKPTKGDAKPAPIKELKFDDDARKEFLLTLHKKKNERRVNAIVESRRKRNRENKQFRAKEREEARKQYNDYAKVPILPNYTFKMPDPLAEEDDENGPVNSDGDDDVEPVEAGASMRDDVAAVFANQATRDRTKQLSGLSLHTSDGDGAVTVEVTPLFGGGAASSAGGAGKKHAGGTLKSGAKNRFVGGLDFSDLPEEVAQKLEEKMKAQRGPSKMKARVNMVREMQKFHKIQKHSRKKKK
eukprot:CAMPEP_0174830160 /NCGR_PEP_ID=MMETSP1114-20130205/2372_1 /TAXON_ID=312471 /ORGANISM="Neobodo designis, Strain CCAP 1951/1" /LENGTH=285 /DNA_ID=CAMNT_0016063947 /DNA_START=41 /DNA_END=898 /DNA_ORIENTATION=-